VRLIGLTFTNNIMQTISGFPNLRHNVFISGVANVTVDNLSTDTDTSYFIYLTNDNGIPGVYSFDGTKLQAPLFVPSLSSISPTDRVPTPDVFTFSGSRIFPCDLKVRIYKSSTDSVPEV
jgi:hypothetical protein